MRYDKMKIFEKATREKIRFEYKGNLSVEDLWDLDVTELDEIFKKLNVEKKSMSEDSLLEKETEQNTLLNTKIKLIKYIVGVKIEELEKQKLASEKKAKKEKIMEILADKQYSELENKSSDELKEMLNSL